MAQIEITLKLRLWGDKLPADAEEQLKESELGRVGGMVRDGYTSGEIVHEDAAGGWWEISTETKEKDRGTDDGN